MDGILRNTLALLAYGIGLSMIVWWSNRKLAASASFQAYYTANKKAPWLAVAIGMIGSSISGVTYISVPGDVGLPVAEGASILKGLGYMQLVVGYGLGYVVIAFALLPLYYRLNLTSIYAYLDIRFGPGAGQAGAGLFVLSRTLGAAARLYLALLVLHQVLLRHLNLPFEASTLLFVGGIAWYTARGGLQTLIWTDVYQTSVFLLGAVAAFGYVVTVLEPGSVVQTISESRYGQLFFWDPSLPNYFWKQFLGGALITICMTGLDQDMMQKNLTIARLDNAQRNMLVYGFLLVVVNLLFVSLGAMLYLFVDSGQTGLSEPVAGDRLLPTVANEVFPPAVSMLVIMGLVAAALNSIDGTLPALTTAVCLNLLPAARQAAEPITTSTATELIQRTRVHWLLAGVLALLVTGFYRYLQTEAHPTLNVISLVLGMATFTYGPLLGFFLFGLTTHRNVPPKALWLVALLMPPLVWLLKEQLKDSYAFGYELLAFNAVLSYATLWVLSTSAPKTTP